MNTRDLLLGELKQFKRQTISELKEIKRDVQSLMTFRWKLIGASAVASFLATLVIEFLRAQS